MCWVLQALSTRRLPCQSDKIPGQYCDDINPNKLTLKCRVDAQRLQLSS